MQLLIFASLIGATFAVQPLEVLHKAIAKTGRVNKGTSVKPGDLPWQAAVRITKQDDTYFCGGSLIAQQFVLSSYSCLADGLNYTVILGALDWGNVTEVGRVEITNAQAILHSGFDPITYHNDIGLINLGRALNYTDNIKPITLPTAPVEVGVYVNISGWGVDTSGAMTKYLTYATLKSISDEECSIDYDFLSASVVCAKGLGVNAGPCTGDTGGPLIGWHNGTAVQHGIFSFMSTFGCGTNFPTGYLRVFNYIEWIRQYVPGV